MPSKLVFTIRLPEPGAPDVVSRKVTVILNGQETLFDGAVTPETSVLGPFSGHDNDAVNVTLVDVDDAGNISPEQGVQFILEDTIPPPKPGQPTLTVVAEVPDESATTTVVTPAEAVVEVTVPDVTVIAEEQVAEEAETAQEGPDSGQETQETAEEVSEVVQEAQEATESESEAVSEVQEEAVETEEAAEESTTEAEKATDEGEEQG
jgi:hypothetical protein